MCWFVKSGKMDEIDKISTVFFPNRVAGGTKRPTGAVIIRLARVRSRTGRRTRFCFRKSCFRSCPRTIRNRPCRRGLATPPSGAGEDAREPAGRRGCSAIEIFGGFRRKRIFYGDREAQLIIANCKLLILPAPLFHLIFK